jgi:hypothetical protein
MRNGLRHEVSPRWIVPITLTLCTAAIFLSRSSSPTLFSRYDWDMVVVALAAGIWAAASWWVAVSADRHQLLLKRLRRARLLLPCAILVAGLALVDLLTELGSYLIATLQACLLSVSVLALLGAALATALLAHSRPRALLQVVAAAVISLVIALAAAELVFRTLLLEPVVPRSQEELRLRLAASWPRPVEDRKPAGTTRLLGLADSFGWVGEEQNYHYLLENRLHEQGRRLQVINLSMPALELPDELRMLSRFAPVYQPDLVLHGLFVGNDLWVPEGELVSLAGISLRTRSGFDAVRPRYFLLSEWLRRSFQAAHDQEQRQLQLEHQQLTGELSHEQFLRIQRKRMAIFRREISDSDPVWAAVTAQLDLIRTEAAAAGATYVMVIHPDQVQVEQALREELATHFHIDPQDYDLSRPQRFLHSYCRTRRLPCIDLLPAFLDQGVAGGLYLTDNTHYNGAGNRLAAEEIASFLEATMLLDNPSYDR